MASWQKTSWQNKLTKSHVDKMSSWQNFVLTKWQVDEMASWQKGKLTKWQVDEMASWQNGKLTKWHADKIEVNKRKKVKKWNIDKMSNWQNGNSIKRQADIIKETVDKMTIRQVVKTACWKNDNIASRQNLCRENNKLTKSNRSSLECCVLV
jgi:hypothetical protein